MVKVHGLMVAGPSNSPRFHKIMGSLSAGLPDGEHKIYVNSHYATYIKARSSEPVRDAK